MSNPWSPEHVVTDETAAKLICQQFPELSPISVKYLAEGWDNTVFTVNKEYIFRFPRRQLADELIVTECRALSHIANNIPIPVSIPIYHGQPSLEYPWHFAGYKRLEGRTACNIRLTKDQRMAMAQPLALFLRSLHNIPVTDASSYGIPPDTIGRLDLQKRIPQVNDRLDRLEKMQFIDNKERWNMVINTAKDVAFVMSDWPLSLVHGDLYVRHLLINDEQRLCGVIDWGDIHIGHSAADLSIVYSFLPPEAEMMFIDSYGPIDNETRNLAMFRALHYALILIEYGRDIEDDNLVREGKQALEYLSLQ